MSGEFEAFIEKNPQFSKYTIKSYKTQYNKLLKLLGKNILDATQNEIIKKAGEAENINSQQALLNIGLVLKKSNDDPYDEIELKRESNKDVIKKAVKQNNADKRLPPLNDLLEMLDKYEEDKQWRNFILLFLLIYYNVRNQDLNITFVDTKKEASDENTNYMWVNKKKKQIVYIRNAYKTSKTYGSKTHVISDEDLYKAVLAFRKTEKTKLIPNEDNVGHWVDVATKDLGSGNVYKIVVNAFKGDLQKLKEMSEKRGSSLDTMAENYDIDNK